MTFLDLCQAHYQVLLIIYQKSFINVQIVSLVLITCSWGDQLIFRCFECKNNDKKDFNKDLIKRFSNTYEFCNGDINNLFYY